MALMYQQAPVIAGVILTACQVVEGLLTFAGPTEVTLMAAAFPAAGTYAIFSYGSISGDPLVYLSFVNSTGLGFDPASLIHDTVAKRITVTLT